MPRGAELKGQVVRVVFQKPPRRSTRKRPPRRRPAPPDHVERPRARRQAPSDRLTLDAPVLTALVSGEREKRRPVALSAIPAADGRRPCSRSRIGGSTSIPASIRFGMVGALFSYADRPPRRISAGGSTITQQLVRNVFLPKFEGMTLQTARDAVAQAQAARAVGVGRPRRIARRRTRSSRCT